MDSCPSVRLIFSAALRESRALVLKWHELVCSKGVVEWRTCRGVLLAGVPVDHGVRTLPIGAITFAELLYKCAVGLLPLGAGRRGPVGPEAAGPAREQATLWCRI